MFDKFVKRSIRPNSDLYAFKQQQSTVRWPSKYFTIMLNRILLLYSIMLTGATSVQIIFINIGDIYMTIMCAHSRNVSQCNIPMPT